MFVEKLRLDGKTIMVVGAGGGGHGTGACIALAEAGADIIAVDISRENLRELEDRLAQAGASCRSIVADATSEEILKTIGAIADEVGGFHGLVNVVGGSQQGQLLPLLDYPAEIFDTVVAFNLRSAFLTCQAAARSMIAHGIRGSILNLSSISGITTAPTHGIYGAAKAGLNALGRTMALEWSEFGIRVNSVAPGNMDVPRSLRHRNTGESDLSFDGILSVDRPSYVVPLGYRGTAADVASAILFFMSDLSSYITGQILAVDGGLSVKPAGLGETIRTLPFTQPDAL
jgi:NAD(P)-dependent dehydrogenase (short-subunit alcohol dehydrogenase family)